MLSGRNVFAEVCGPYDMSMHLPTMYKAFIHFYARVATDTPKRFKLSSVGCTGNKKVAVVVPTASCDVKYIDSPSVGKNTICVRTLTTVLTVYGVDLRQGDLTYCLSSTDPRQSII